MQTSFLESLLQNRPSTGHLRPLSPTLTTTWHLRKPRVSSLPKAPQLVNGETRTQAQQGLTEVGAHLATALARPEAQRLESKSGAKWGSCHKRQLGCTHKAQEGDHSPLPPSPGTKAWLSLQRLYGTGSSDSSGPQARLGWCVPPSGRE